VRWLSFATTPMLLLMYRNVLQIVCGNHGHRSGQNVQRFWFQGKTLLTILLAESVPQGACQAVDFTPLTHLA
jgi:hypothetical protein